MSPRWALQKVLTGSARANESQIKALQATVPGLEISSDIVQKKLGAFSQNISMLRQGIPRLPGMDVIPLKQPAPAQQRQQQQQPGARPVPLGMTTYGGGH